MQFKNQAILISCVSLALAAGIATAQDAQVTADPLLHGATAAKEQQHIRDSKIKSMTVWQYLGTPSGVSDKGVQISKVVYDAQGHAVVQTGVGPAGAQTQTEQHYDPNGRLMETVKGIAGAQSKIDYQYNQAGKVQEAVGHAADGSPNLDLKYEYDAQGRVARAVTAMAGRGITEDTVEYGPDGKQKLVKMVGHYVNGSSSVANLSLEAAGGKYDLTVSDRKGVVISHTQSSLDAAGNVIDLVQLNGKGDILSKMHSSYDGNGNVIRKTMMDADGKQILDTMNTYDGSGKLAQTVTVGPAGRVHTDFAYNEHGDLATETRYDSQNRPVEVLKYVYEYSN